MSPRIYNACMGTGLVLVSVGAGLVYLPAGFITAGSMLIGMTVLTLRLAGRGDG